MADQPTVPGAPPVTDRRPVPSGVLPRRFQTWLMAGLAAGIVLIILVAGEPGPPPGPTPAPAAQAQPNADRLREYQERLRAMEARAALEAQAPEPTPEPTFGEPPAQAPEDPIAAERRRRNYESLFASNVVLSRRAESHQPDTGSRRPEGSQPAGTASADPSLDAVAEAVVRATTRGAGVSTDSLSSPSRDARPVAAAPTSAGRERPSLAERTHPISAAGPVHRLLEGTFIDAVLANRLDGSAAAPVNVLVTNPVFSHSGQHILIPAGARVLGETRPVQSLGESRLAVTFHRLVMPDGGTYRLDQFQGMNQIGDAGLRDRVNQHYWSTFGAAAAVGLISGLSQWLGTAGLSRGSGDRTVVIAGGAADAASQASLQVMSRFLNRLPTVTIREGHRVKVYLTSDLDLPAYGGIGRSPGR